MTEQRYIAHGLVVRDREYLLIRRRVGRYFGEQWDIPGGTVEAGETAAIAAARECLEEVGLQTSAQSEISHFENFDTEGRDINFHTYTYLLKELDGRASVYLSDEHDDFIWVSVADALDLPLVWHVRKTLEMIT